MYNCLQLGIGVSMALLSFLLFCSAVITAAVSAADTPLHFYMHDTVTGPNVTALKVVPSGARPDVVNFGDITVIDDPLTDGPSITSKLTGHARGTYVAVSQTSLLLTVSLVFVGGKYNGSTLAVAGVDDILTPVRELAIVGGTGVFRKARGYLVWKTYTFNATSGNAVLELDAYVDA